MNDRQPATCTPHRPSPARRGAFRAARRASRAFLPLVAASTLLLAAAAAIVPAPALADDGGCQVTLDRSGWTAIRQLIGEISEGKEVPNERFQELWGTEGYAVLARLAAEREINPVILANCTRYAFTERTKPAVAPRRRDLVDNFIYLKRKLVEADRLADMLSAASLQDEICERLSPFVRPGELPDVIQVHLLAMGPVIKYEDGDLVLDLGLALAAGQEHLPDVLASVIYREVGRERAPEPRKTPLGEAALRATFERLVQEGVAAYIEGWDRLDLDSSHPSLSVKPEARRVPYVRGRESLQILQASLHTVLTEENGLQGHSLLLDDLLRGSGAYPLVGFVMASLIADTYGVDRLHELSDDPIGFLNAYQEAARKRPPEAVERGVDPVQHGLNNLPPFDSPDFDALMRIMRAGD